MLDKSIPYAEIWMKRAHKSTPIQPVQSDNYSLRSYQAGDERHWARIETSVGEFDNEAEALAYFEKEFMPEQAQLGQRMFFALDQSGTPVGTATAWKKAKESLAAWSRKSFLSWRQPTSRCIFIRKPGAMQQSRSISSSDL